MILELFKRFTLIAPKGIISPAGIVAINAFIAAQRPTADDVWKAINPTNKEYFLPDLPDSWQWFWVVTGRGEYVGTFPKRLSKYYHKVHGINCPPTFLQEIGNIARRHTEDNLSYHFDFTNRFNWRAGDFDDRGSCFWGSNANAREAMENHGGLAIRFYESAESDKGIARAWLMPIGNSLYIIFNGYGFTTLVIARAFSMFLNLSYKKIALSNFGDTSGTLYINNDSGYIIGSPDAIESYEEYDFEIEVSEYICESCGVSLSEDDYYSSPDGVIYCNNCYYERYGQCDICYEDYHRDYLNYVESTDQDVCNHCLSREFSYCDSCGEYYQSDKVQAYDGKWYCDECFSELPPEESDESEETE